MTASSANDQFMSAHDMVRPTRPMTVCPPWCRTARDRGSCNGDHIAEMLWVPATANTVPAGAGCYSETVTVYGNHCEVDGYNLCVTVSLSDSHADASADLTLPEVRQLIEKLQLALGQVDGLSNTEPSDTRLAPTELRKLADATHRLADAYAIRTDCDGPTVNPAVRS